MKEINVVSAGTYSDYRVLFACPDKETAEKLAAQIRDDANSWHSDARVEQLFMLDKVEKIEELRMSVVVSDAGICSEERTWTNQDWSFQTDYVNVAWRWIRAPCYANEAGRLDVWGLDHKAVGKVFSEKRAQAVADVSFRKTHELKGEKRRR